MAAASELYYRLVGPARGTRPGHHRSHSGTSGFEFRGHALLVDAPDARRLDLHASLRDPFGNWIVRQYNERKSITVAVVADLSASMAFEGRQRKLDVLCDLVESLAPSAWRLGDSFGFVGCDEVVRNDLLLPPTRQRGAGAAWAQTLRALQLSGTSARGLLQAHRHLPARRSLLFLVSDFHLPLDLLEQVLSSLAVHEVVPVVVWQAAEFEIAVPYGLALTQEPESGRRQWLWWRPALRERWAAAALARREALEACFRAYRLAPLFIEGAFDADAVTRHFVS